MENNNKSPKEYNKWLAFINIPIQMGVIIYAFYWLGLWLDSNYPNEKIFYYKALTLVGVFIALYNVYRQVNQIGNR
ncbi:AtpZ/AtpI family protein [Flavobacterium terrae]|uniref:Putative F0F1-ATPase subunit Ca2+/Mg2+ transporter n=1 Tax=Flavobacterium terrae TaxID=415425 RepID=A0A1M6ARD8_9FLAO|nr:AtpZ/AtpI family protein [Flavobacterium terrae]SHI39015.1 Putative F0F1-ATPase subunit Ca2+/Mg2+ transporter [Flavobacterium terrae]